MNRTSEMNKEQEKLTTHQLYLLDVFENVWMEGHKNNVVASRARILAYSIMDIAPNIASRLVELSGAIGIDYEATDFTLAFLGD